MFLLLDFEVDEIAILSQFANERIDLTQGEWRSPLQIAADETILVDVEFQCRSRSILHGGDTVLLGQGEHTQDAADRSFPLSAVNGVTECADVGASAAGSGQQLHSR